MNFEWDKNKENSNIEKHRVDFNQAKEVFHDTDKIGIPDERKDYNEERILVIGKSMNLILSVIYTMRGVVVRIISARSASRKERKLYNDSKI